MTNSLGPWTTALDTGPSLGLSVFWKRRMTMLNSLSRSTCQLRRGARWTLATLVLLLLMLPAIRLSERVLAEDAAAEAGGASAEPAGKSPAVDFLPAPSAAEKKLLAALEHPTEMDFHEAPLQDVVDYLSDLHQVPIKLDTKALEEAGIGTDTPATLAIEGVSLRSGLAALLRPLDMTWVLRDEVLLLTTEEQASQWLLTRTYPVGDLVASADFSDVSDLCQAITSTIRPDSWDEGGGPGSLSVVKASRSIVVSQTRVAHDELVELLRSLRVARDRQGPAPAAPAGNAKTSAAKSPAKSQPGGGMF